MNRARGLGSGFGISVAVLLAACSPGPEGGPPLGPDGGPPPAPPTYSVRGSVTGLAGSGLVLRLNGGGDLPVARSGTSPVPFQFTTRLPAGAAYAVTVGTPPASPSQTCVVTNGEGLMPGGDVTNVAVACTTTPVHAIGGTASGLLGPGLVLRNGTEDLAVPADGEFTFPTRVAEGLAYDVAAVSAPKGQVCSVSAGAGTVSAGPVAGIAVRCTERHLTDGAVWAVAQGADGTTYLGGSFTWIATATGAAVPLDVTTGRRAAPYPYVDGDVWHAAPDGAGGWYLAGSFESVGGVARNHLAHVLANGAVDPAFDPNPNAIVTALAVWGGTVYVGGGFTRIGGQDRIHLAALTAAGSATAWNPGANFGDGIDALAVSEDGARVYVGGDFFSIGGQSRENLAAIDAATGAATAFRADTDGPMSETDISGTVFALAVSGDTLYVGGRFVGLGGQPRNHVGAVDATTGALLPWNPNPTHSGGGIAPVHALVVDGGVVYAGGWFTSIGGQPRNNVAALDATGTGTALAWNPGVNGQVRAVALAAGRVVVAGEFTIAGGQPRRNLAALDASTGNATAFTADTNGYWVVALAVSGSTVYAGGDFTAVGSQPRRNLAAIDPTTGEVTPWDPSPDDVVYALAVREATVYAGGNFTAVGGQPRSRLAAIEAATGDATAWNPGADGSVQTLAILGETIYVAGDFASVAGQARPRLAAIDASGSATAFAPAPSPATSWVYAIVPHAGAIHVGGSFTSIGGQPRNRLAALDPTTGEATGWNPDANGTVHALAVSGGTVYAGGEFTTVGGLFNFRNRLAAVDATSGALLAWNPGASGMPYDTRVRALAVARGRVHVGGEFNTVGSATRLRLASIDQVTGATTPWSPRPDAEVYRLFALGGVLHVGGAFSLVGGERFRGYTELMP